MDEGNPSRLAPSLKEGGIGWLKNGEDGRVLFLLRDYQKDPGCRNLHLNKKISHSLPFLPFVSERERICY